MVSELNPEATRMLQGNFNDDAVCEGVCAITHGLKMDNPK